MHQASFKVKTWQKQAVNSKEFQSALAGLIVFGPFPTRGKTTSLRWPRLSRYAGVSEESVWRFLYSLLPLRRNRGKVQSSSQESIRREAQLWPWLHGNLLESVAVWTRRREAFWVWGFLGGGRDAISCALPRGPHSHPLLSTGRSHYTSLGLAPRSTPVFR